MNILLGPQLKENNPMNRIKILKIILFFISIPFYSLGFNANFAFVPGITECFFGEQVETNKNVWDDFENPLKYISFGGRLTADVILNQKFSIESGLEYKNINLNYIAKDNNLYANGQVNINYSALQLPILFKYSIAIKKTTSVIDSLNIALGPTVSYIMSNQTYKDELTTTAGSFLNPFLNAGLELDVTFSHVLGPGKLFIGLKTDFSFIPLSYKISGNQVNLGCVLSGAPLIGYTFIIQEDKNLTKITEKNKRIKDIFVE